MERKIVERYFEFTDNLQKHIDVSMSRQTIVETFYEYIFYGTDTKPSEMTSEIRRIFTTKSLVFPDNEDEMELCVYNELLRLKTLPKDEYAQLILVSNNLKNDIDQRVQELDNRINALMIQKENITERQKQLKLVMSQKRKAYIDYSSEEMERQNLALFERPKIDYEVKKYQYFKNVLAEQKNEILKADFSVKAISNAAIYSEGSEYKYFFCDFQWLNSFTTPDFDNSVSLKFRRTENRITDKYKYLRHMEKDEDASLLLENYKYKTKDIEKLKKHDTAGYFELLKKYIDEEDVCQYILDSVKSSHILANRMGIIEHAVNMFSDEKYTAFINLMAIQIEGVFFDLLNELEGIPDDLGSFTINGKIENLDKMTILDSRVYFAYEFPLIRNRVAHGVYVKNNATRNEAYEMLLDAQYLVYEITEGNYLAYNGPLNYFKKYKNKELFCQRITRNSGIDVLNQCLFDYLDTDAFSISLEWLYNPKHEKIYSFYNLLDVVIEFRRQIVSDSFLDYLDEKIERMMHGEDRDYSIAHEKSLIWKAITSRLCGYYNRNTTENSTCIRLKEISKKMNKRSKMKGA